MTAKPDAVDYVALARECEQYAAWNSPPWFTDAFGRVAAALREAGRVREDAERYRWIRCADLSVLMPLIETYAGEEFDEHVDTARKQP